MNLIFHIYFFLQLLFIIHKINLKLLLGFVITYFRNEKKYIHRIHLVDLNHFEPYLFDFFFFSSFEF